MKKLLSICCLIVATLPFNDSWAQKAEENKCDFVISCPSKEMAFSIAVNSKSKDCTEDDAEFTLKRKTKAVKLDLPQGWYYDIDNIGSIKSVCKSTYEEYPIFKISETQALIFLRKNNRPNLDTISAAVIDFKTSKVVDQKNLGTTLRTSIGIIESSSGYKLPLVKENLKEVRCDCDAAFVEGWLRVSVVKGKIQTDWL